MKAPQTPPAFQDLFDSSDAERLGRVLSAGIRATVDGKYRHWDNVRQLTPPQGLSLQDWWLGIKLARMGTRRELPITDTSGHRFTYTTPDEAAEALHDIDQRASGTITVSEIVMTESAQRRYLVNSLIEESIIVALVCIVFLFHVRSALVSLIVLPLGVLMAFVAMRGLGINADIIRARCDEVLGVGEAAS